ncbi:F0F1 ATP synthase subunit gamma [Variovorax sp. dw_308]|uniref:F0F1 ATP synthase subunit gamma n=1 Tax=Variovorax sp. dw_308 TaxID=2721546 RepID=UPI001C489290|nr:F0F1 ATP synthase subunit gamma [Variovorax sp. dw_308]
MADTSASLRRKIASAGDLQSVVRAMKSQAAASVGQYERSVAALGDYARTVELGLGACFRSSAPLDGAPPSHGQAGRAIRAVIFGSDQGLVGRFNDVVLDHARATLAALPATAQVWAVGDRISSGLADRRTLAAGVFAVPRSVQAITALVGQVMVKVVGQDEAHEAPGARASLYLFNNRPVSGSAYEPVSQRLLPLDESWRRKLADQPWPTGMLPEVLGEVPREVPGEGAMTLRALIREYLFVSIFRAAAESLASENASRLAAMDRADHNIEKMLRTLGGSFHRLRQSSIDDELSDVVAGFKALGAGR